VLQDAIAGKYEDRFRVYDREGERCPTRGCSGGIRRITQGGRSTFYCRLCQR
jgi:formamidopyrimidine-DNA glycosylase